MVVIRYEGPKGGPGMPEMLTPTSAIMGAGLGKECALITDGRFRCACVWVRRVVVVVCLCVGRGGWGVQRLALWQRACVWTSTGRSQCGAEAKCVACHCSGGSHGFVIGHVCPEAQEGGPIALVKVRAAPFVSTVGCWPLPDCCLYFDPPCMLLVYRFTTGRRYHSDRCGEAIDGRLERG